MTKPAQASALPGASAPPWRTAALVRESDLPGWSAARRSAALARLDDTGLPDGSEEDWRYTTLKAYTQRWASYLAAPDNKPAATPPGHDTEPAGLRLRVVDGVLAGFTGDLPRGLLAGSLRKLPPALAARAEDLLRKADGLAADSLLDLNTALLSDVILITTETDAHLDGAPLHVDLRSSGTPAFGQPRVLVDVAPGSRLTLILEHSGQDGALANSVTQVWIAAGAHLDIVRVQRLPDDGMLTDTSHLELGAGASANVTSVDLGGGLSRQSMTIRLSGAGASADVNGLFLADGHRHLDNRTRLEHRAPSTTSRESFRGLADGHGRGVFNGKIIVTPGAAGSNAALTNRNLLLAATAEIDTKPELEIYVDDVRCSHGATTGQLDEAALFYLRSRGLDLAAARQVLTAAFLLESLAGIPDQDLRANLEGLLRTRLGSDAAAGTAGAGP